MGKRAKGSKKGNVSDDSSKVVKDDVSDVIDILSKGSSKVLKSKKSSKVSKDDTDVLKGDVKTSKVSKDDVKTSEALKSSDKGIISDASLLSMLISRINEDNDLNVSSGAVLSFYSSDNGISHKVVLKNGKIFTVSL